MRFFLFVSLLSLLIMTSPVSANPGRNMKARSTDTIKSWEPVFDSSFRKGLFRSTMDIGKNHLTGFIFIKQITDTSYRILFSNEIGMKYFDLEFFPKDFIVHYCFPAMERKSLLNLIENDFRILFYTDQNIRKVIPQKTNMEEEKVLMIRSDLGKWQLRVSSSSGKILFIRSVNRMISKTRIALDYSEGLTTGIQISNPVIGLTLSMYLISP